MNRPIRILPPRLVAALVLAILVSGAPAHAFAQGPPGGRGPRQPHASAAADTSFMPDWMHPWFELGGGWLAAPNSLQRDFESGQALGAGIAVRPLRRLQLRSALDFQMLTVQRSADIVIYWGKDPQGHDLLDTTTTHFTGNAWMGLLRNEVGVEVAHDLWLTAGGGGGWMDAGFGPFDKLSGPGGTGPVPVAKRNGWGWSWTTAARWDIQPVDLAQLGIDVRMTTLRRGPDDLRMWSIRACYRMPDKARHPGRTPR